MEHGTGNGNLPPYGFSQGKADGFNLDVVKLKLEKPIDQVDNWSAGYKVDLVMGPDADLLTPPRLEAAPILASNRPMSHCTRQSGMA